MAGKVVIDASYVIEEKPELKKYVLDAFDEALKRFDIIYLTPDLNPKLLEKTIPGLYYRVITNRHKVKILVDKNMFSPEEIESIKRKWAGTGVQVEVIDKVKKIALQYIRGRKKDNISISPNEYVIKAYQLHEGIKRKIYEGIEEYPSDISAKTDLMLNNLPEEYIIWSADRDITGIGPTIHFVSHYEREKGWIDLAFLIGILALPIIIGIIKERIKRV